MVSTEYKKTVKGFERFLTPEDIAALLQRPVRYVREKLIVPGIIKGTKTGGNSWRVSPREFQRWMDAGCPTGDRFSQPSGRWRGKEAACG